MIPWQQVLTEPVFSYITPEGEHMLFASRRIIEWCERVKRSTIFIKIDEAMVRHIVEKHGVEPHRLAAIQGMIREPVLFIDFEDGTHTCIDGNHRIVQAYRYGASSIRSFAPLGKRHWQPFLVEPPPDMRAATPEHLRKVMSKMRSGL